MDEIKLKYAVLWHSDTDEPHYDLMIETYPGSGLATWRSPVWPIEQPTTLQRLRDHRRIFLDYEGDLSGHRGRVQRIADGNCDLVIGENSVWTIELLNQPIKLILGLMDNDRWSAIPG